MFLSAGREFNVDFLIALTLTLVVNTFILKFLFALSGPMYSSVPEFSTEQNKKPLNAGFSFLNLGTTASLLPTLSG